ncbi:phosphoprotein phosphatase, putative [Trichomonas vaginalis G3]|uniref:Phosphoprotein phosphatase, putative n=1 Tax=Trichomonas vaginalis (strain ATCC PRA-98 / G3) TaxID=412133 RepID=A2F924_TRIV3|nr:protein phosphatase regulator protein [Trichomonas vaginalis G3]EAX98599.1 phosphoprotein phosphatase, putative [Trichomonas vaginalis G3]KAI5498388.1 protein phosphatase regulator protein [Trichomonas vaginalis G3]|eukprot:XP_001311529.1 phosphoprotein phosphatase [Trichomonas vaginalis G3]
MEQVRTSLSRLTGPKIIQPMLNSKNPRPVAPVEGENLSFEDSRSLKSVDSTEGIALIKTHRMIQIPVADTGSNIQHFHSVSSQFFDLNIPIKFTVEPKLEDTPLPKLNQLLMSKCNMCCQICNFNDPEIQKEDKQQKTEILQDIFKTICNMDVIAQLTEAEYHAIYKMFMKNVIRTSPAAPIIWFSPINTDLCQEMVEEAAWPHLALCYDILNSLITSPKFYPTNCPKEVNTLAKTIVEIFHSPDSRERDKLMKLFHSFYRVCSKHRSIMRQSVYRFLNDYLEGACLAVGVSELLTVTFSIVSGLKVPLHEEYTDFFEEIIARLHGDPLTLQFQRQLFNVVNTFCNKQATLSFILLAYLRRHWPSTSPMKEVLFLSEVENLIQYIPTQGALEQINNLTTIISRCSCSDNFAVAERALMMWQNENFANLILSYSLTTFPILLPALFKTANYHWCQSVCTLAVYVLRLLKGGDPSAFDDIGGKMKNAESERVVKEIERGHTWQRILNAHAESEEHKEKVLKEIAMSYIGNENALKKAQQQQQNNNNNSGMNLQLHTFQANSSKVLSPVKIMDPKIGSPSMHGSGINHRTSQGNLMPRRLGDLPPPKLIAGKRKKYTI